MLHNEPVFHFLDREDLLFSEDLLMGSVLMGRSFQANCLDVHLSHYTDIGNGTVN